MNIFKKLFGISKNEDVMPTETPCEITSLEKEPDDTPTLPDQGSSLSTAPISTNVDLVEDKPDQQSEYGNVEQKSVDESHPTTLYSALRYIVDKLHVDLDDSKYTINILNDFQLFKDTRKLKYILSYILDNECFEIIKKSSADWHLTELKTTQTIIEQTGLQANLVKYVVSCIGYGLGKTNAIPDESCLEPYDEKQDQTVTEHPSNDTTKDIARSNEDGTLIVKYNSPELWKNSSDEMLNAIGHIKASLSKDAFWILPLLKDGDCKNYVFSSGDNVLIAGGSQMGKSTLLHQSIISLLYSLSPDDIQFILMDEFGLQLNRYSCLENQFLACSPNERKGVVKDSLTCLHTLHSVLFEANKRLKIIKEAGCSDWFTYINKIRNGAIEDKQSDVRDFPYLFIIIEELSSFLSGFRSDIEYKLSRLSQLSNMVGISIIATTNQVTGECLTPALRNIFNTKILFKNFNSSSGRIFGLPYKTLSNLGTGEFVVLDKNGVSPYSTSLIQDDDIKSLIDFIAAQNISQHPYYTANDIDGSWIGKSPVSTQFPSFDATAADPLLHEVAKAIHSDSTVATVSSLQRKFGIGYIRAGKIMDQLESLGIVSLRRSIYSQSASIDMCKLEQFLKE